MEVSVLGATISVTRKAAWHPTWAWVPDFDVKPCEWRTLQVFVPKLWIMLSFQPLAVRSAGCTRKEREQVSPNVIQGDGGVSE